MAAKKRSTPEATKPSERKVEGMAGQELSGEGSVESGETDAGQESGEGSPEKGATDAPEAGGELDSPQAAPDSALPTPDSQAAPDSELPTPDSVSIDVPVGAIDPEVQLSDHVDGRLTLAQRRGLRFVLNGADASGARLKNGRVVQTLIDAVRLVLERIDAAVGGESGEGS